MTNEHETPVDEPTESQLADLVRAAAAVAVPDGVRAAVARADRPEAGPQAGELWRARRPGGTVTMVWLRSLSASGAVTVPVSFDTDFADEDILVVPGDASPLALPLALHFGAESTIDRHSLLDRLGSIEPDAVRAARTARAEAPLPLVDESRADLEVTDQDWWPLDTLSERADLLKALHQSLGESHPGARIAPRPVAPFQSVVVDRRDVVAAIETPSGQLRPPRQSRPDLPVGTALSKFLDATISPFGRLARTFVEGQALDPRALAVDVSADAVRTVHNSAKGFKTEGKRPGYERVKRHQAEITRLVEAALNQPGLDVAAILEPESPETPEPEP
jgi:hypothetical protein